MREYYHRAQGGPLGVKLLHGQKQMWPEKDWATVAVGDLTGVAHDIQLDVAAGDVVRFVLDKGTVPEHDLIAWMPRIVYDEATVPASSAVVRILCGAKSPYTDRCGNVWAADQHFAGGESVSTKDRIEEAFPTLDDQPLYQNGRAGKDFSYSIPVTTGLYAVRLKFAEPKHPWMFERPFNLDINGQQVLTDFDIVQTAKAPRQAVERTFRNIVPNADGKIVLHFTAGKTRQGTSDGAMVQAIEVLPEQKPAVRINAGSEVRVSSIGTVAFGPRTRICRAERPSNPPCRSFMRRRRSTIRSCTARPDRPKRSATPLPRRRVCTRCISSSRSCGWRRGERPMDIEINGGLVRKAWDPASAAGRTGMAIDLRFDNITPDKDGRIVVGLRATGANDAILQAIEIE